jgi:hypothetical protein
VELLAACVVGRDDQSYCTQAYGICVEYAGTIYIKDQPSTSLCLSVLIVHSPCSHRVFHSLLSAHTRPPPQPSRFGPAHSENAQQHGSRVVLLPLPNPPLRNVSSDFPPASKDQDAEPHHHLEAARFSPLAYVLGWVRWVVSQMSSTKTSLGSRPDFLD